MIARLEGRLADKLPDAVVVDVAGVGYHVFVSIQTLAALPGVGEPVRLHVHTHVREDALQLYGFREDVERRLFLLLKEVSGIGPRLALNVLSGIPAAELVEALRGGDVGRLVGVPGVGRKTAERMIVELRDKAGGIVAADGTPTAAGGSNDVREQAVSALVNLGYKRPDADREVRRIMDGGRARFEDVVRDALRGLAS